MIELPQYYNTSNPADVIRVANPGQHTNVASPLTITGEARGTWYFEAVFSIILTDAKGKILARTQARAQNDWQTADLVSFLATLSFPWQPGSTTGRLIFQKNNPSGLSQNDAYAVMTVTF
jgi:hypothetical protein